jgi:hypothetical protein
MICPQVSSELIFDIAEDSVLRESIARHGKQYALSRGGENRLAAGLICELSMLIGAPVARGIRVTTGRLRRVP